MRFLRAKPFKSKIKKEKISFISFWGYNNWFFGFLKNNKKNSTEILFQKQYEKVEFKANAHDKISCLLLFNLLLVAHVVF